ncbi:MAG: chromosome segregation protein SMC [Christensenellaceae bacterium]|jgi:chromosome segregation protein|nr:chromosome segregation protein SMC [Christensenellaceae bacterium]
MNLKKIVIHGFKSFADKVVIDFDSGFTGIVGPNGCGKSNIVDTIRWVLGERNARVLRCQRMAELIFNGTNDRKPQSICEASLYLDNKKRTYPSITSDELIITRKIHRGKDGGEYYINNLPVKLSDVMELFRDSGMGHDGYSIIGQGKIADIISAKPEVRRQIFDEAAGISKHKARKAESEKNLKETRNNIVNLGNILEILRQSLVPLEKEAKNAVKVRDFKRRLKFQDINFFLFQMENGDTERKNLQTKLAKIVADIDTYDEEYKDICKRYNILMMDLTNSDQLSNKLRAEQTDLLVSIERKQGAANVIAERLRNLREQRKQFDAETQRLNERFEQLTVELAEKTESYNNKNLELLRKEANYAEIQSEYESICDEVAQQEKELEQSALLISQRKDEFHALDKDLVKLEVKLSLAHDDIEKAKATYREKKTVCDTRREASEKLRASRDILLQERERKEKDKEVAERNYYSTLGDLREAELRKKKLDDEYKTLTVGINYRKDQINDYAGYSDVIKRLMNDAKTDDKLKNLIHGTVGEVIKVQPHLQVAIEISLGQSVQNIITSTPKDAGILIDYLKNKNYGRATFLPMSTVRPNPLPSEFDRALNEKGVIDVASNLVKCDKKFDGVISNLLGRIVIVEDKDTAIAVQQKYRQGFRIVTLGGESFATSGAITGGSAPSKNSRVLSLETDLQAMLKRRNSITKDLTLLDEEIKDFEEESKKMDHGVKILDARIHALEIEIEKYNTQISGTEGNLKELEEEVEKLFEKITMESKQATELDNLIKEAAGAHISVGTERTTADEIINEAREKFNQDKQKKETLFNAANTAVLDLTTLKIEINNRSNDITLIKTDLNKIDVELKNLTFKCTENAREILDAEGDVDISAYSEEDKKLVDEMAKKVQDIDSYKSGLKSSIDALDALKNEKQVQMNFATEKRIKEESRIERIQNDLDNLLNRIRDEYDIDEQTARAYAESMQADPDLVFIPEKAQSEMQSLKRDIDKIGPINELAEDHFYEEKRRYTETKLQFDDLVKAEEELIKIIDDLTNEMTTKFTNRFNIINKNFNQVFQDLFGGGSAKLELNLEDGTKSILEAGIEIKAQPPNKQLTNMSLLSGGEQSLIAISILFAIIKMNPMPFCVLDEIEAALDDSNVDLFAQYLKKFCKTTQFIVVTHRKPTMSLCEFMYGVTMEGSGGISKIVSVTMDEAQSNNWFTTGPDIGVPASTDNIVS